MPAKLTRCLLFYLYLSNNFRQITIQLFRLPISFIVESKFSSLDRFFEHFFISLIKFANAISFANSTNFLPSSAGIKDTFNVLEYLSKSDKIFLYFSSTLFSPFLMMSIFPFFFLLSIMPCSFSCFILFISLLYGHNFKKTIILSSIDEKLLTASLGFHFLNFVDKIIAFL